MTTPPPIVGRQPPALDVRDVAIDEGGRIAEDVACRSCGYNLRGLSPQATCPECATAIALSIHGDLLRFSDPVWVDRLAKGLLWIITGLIASVVFSILVGIVSAVVAGPGRTVSMRSLVLVGGLVGVALGLVTVLGAWWLTTPDPGQTETEPPITARRLARWCITAQVASSSLQMMGIPGGGMAFGIPGVVTTPLQEILMVAGMGMGIVVLIGDVAALIYLRQLALRIPRASLAKQTRIVMWGYASAQAMAMIFGIIVIRLMLSIAPGTLFVVPNMVIGIGGCVGLALLVFSIWALVLLFLYRVALQRAAAKARATWAVA